MSDVEESLQRRLQIDTSGLSTITDKWTNVLREEIQVLDVPIAETQIVEVDDAHKRIIDGPDKFSRRVELEKEVL